MLKIHLIKIVDRWLGAALVHLLPKPSLMSQPVGELHSILLIRPGGIGDAVHLAPAIQALQKSFPDIVIDILAERRNAGIFALCPGLRKVYLYDQSWQLLQAVRGRYDVVIDTEQWHRLSAVIARLVKSPIKVGYATNERARLFTHPVSYSHDDYEIVSFLRLMEPLRLPSMVLSEDPWLQVPEAARESVASLLPAHDDHPLVVIFPGASIAERRWGAERFRTVAQWCVEQGLRIVVVGGAGDRDDGQRIVFGLEALNLAGCTSLPETAAMLERAAVVVSGDSGILHIAVGLGRPTVSLFGPGLAAKWAPHGARHAVLNKHLPCSPCTRFGYTPPCPDDARCLRDIDVDDVISAIGTLMAHPTGKGGV